MKRETILVGFVGFLLGIVVAGFIAGQAVNRNNTGMMRMMGMDTARTQPTAVNHDTMSMVDMAGQLTDKSGDEFDKAFIEMMISHHEGAVAMAELASSRAKHSEIKQLSEAVIAAQTKEITDLKQWQKDWGYAANEMMQMMHGSH